LKSVYYGVVQPHFDYCCEVWNAINRVWTAVWTATKTSQQMC
jgi:hypothetical protein